jgi:poly-gamma-glutamate synthesis protein (capsule biosynthesis protein)
MKIIVGGDFCPINYPVNQLRPFRNIRSFIDEVDFRIINLEAPLTEYDCPTLKTGPSLKLHPEVAGSLKEAGINLVTLANNHIHDYGSSGILDTLDACRKHGVSHVGAGKNLEEAASIFYTKLKGQLLAVINVAENEWGSADRKQAGYASLDPYMLFTKMQEAKRITDNLLVIVHGGHEEWKYPSPRMIRTYRLMALWGASAVIGHHSHCVGGYEVYQNVPIFYSLGNLFFPWPGREVFWNNGLLLTLELEKGKVSSFAVNPFKQNIDAGKIEMLIDNERDSVLNEIKEINRVIQDEEALTREWDAFVRSRYDLDSLLLSGLNKVRLLRGVLKYSRVMRLFENKDFRKTFLGLIRCESHRDILINGLSTSLKSDSDSNLSSSETSNG